MTKRGLIVASILGLVAAIIAALLLSRAAAFQSIDLLVLAFDILAAGLAGRVILGPVRVHRYFALGVVVLSAVAAAIFTSATTNDLIGLNVSFGAPNYAPTAPVLTAAIVAFVVYLLAATVYGFASSRQGVGIGARIGLLLLLLLAVLPLLNVLGLIGFTITTLARPAATPAPAAASE
ncbi:MAG: hypothetical protein QOH69_2514 [Actinomycetota bacterium]|jgi:hypothetical protein|nr:hypothetical protein [Actinomycetota bacterium]